MHGDKLPKNIISSYKVYTLKLSLIRGINYKISEWSIDTGRTSCRPNHSPIGDPELALNNYFHRAHCWQFRLLISNGGALFGERKLYYSPETAF